MNSTTTTNVLLLLLTASVMALIGVVLMVAQNVSASVENFNESVRRIAITAANLDDHFRVVKRWD